MGAFFPPRPATGGGAPEETARVRLVSGGYFSTLGVKAAAGRMFTAEVDRAHGASPSAVISYVLWKQRFGLDPTILGKTIRIYQTPFEIMGVTEQGFFGESLVLAFLGATLGLLIAQWTDALLLRMVSGASLGPESIQLNLRSDAHALGFTLVVAALTAVLFGLIPALRASHLDVSPALKSSSAGVTGETAHRRLPAGKLLVIAQVAVSLVLLVAAGLFVHSLARLSEVSVGYNREKLLLFRVDAAPAGYKGPANLRLHLDLLAKFSADPGVTRGHTFQQRLVSRFGLRRFHSGGRLHAQARRGNPVSDGSCRPRLLLHAGDSVADRA